MICETQQTTPFLKLYIERKLLGAVSQRFEDIPSLNMLTFDLN